MNYTVHAVMYGYYCLMALRMKPKWLPIVITFMQLSQMVVGVGVQIALIKHAYSRAARPTSRMSSPAASCTSYFGLFFKFLVERFFLTSRAKRGTRRLRKNLSRQPRCESR